MVVGSGVGVKAPRCRRRSRISSGAARRGAEQAALHALQRAAVGQRHEQRVVAGDGARDLRPARPVQRGGDGVRRAGQRAQRRAAGRPRGSRAAGRPGACAGGPRRMSRPRSGAAAARRPRCPRGSTLIRPSSATSRLIVAWVVRKPRSRSAAASSCWVRIGRWSTRSRIARWRSCFMTSIGRAASARRSQTTSDDRREHEAVPRRTRRASACAGSAA